jgi:PAS domain S-box-containing protein
MSGQPLFDAAGQFMGYRGVARDMTGEQQWARAVQESEDRFRRLAESVTDVFWFFEVDPRRLIYTSPSFEQVYGYPVQALRDNPDLWLEMIHPDDRPAVDAGFSDWLQRPNAASFDVEYRILRPDGSVRWIHNRGAHRDRTLDGRIQISGIAIDITDRKQLETALRRSEERVRIATEFGGVGTWERDLRTGTIQWSRSVGPIFGLPAQERKLSLEELLAYVHPDDRDRLTQVRQAWFEGKGDYHVEHRIVWPDGTVRWVYQRGNLYRAADGRPVRTSGVVLDITDRKLAEIALRDSEARFRALTSLGSDWVWEQDEELRFTFFSTSSHEQSPDWADTAIGKTRWELPFVDVTQAEWDAHRAILQQQLPFRDFVARLCRDGGIYTLSISGAPMFDDAGRFRGYRGITTDITAREEARRAIEESEDRFRLFAEQTRDVVWIAARGLRQFHYLSPSFEAIWGWPREDLLNDANAWRKHVYPEDLTHLHEVMSRNRDSPECEVEYRIMRPDGEVRWLVSRSSVIASSSGQHLVCGLTEDITERKRTEAALRRSDEFFRQLADNIEQVFWISYPDLSRVLYVSPAYERLFGRPRETIYEDPSSWEQGVHPDDVQRIREFVLRQEAGLPAGTELRVVRPDGSVRWAWAQSTPFVSSSGEHLVAGIVHDVTERKEREEGRVLHAIAQRDALVREVHHRIKNNLQGVVGLLRRLVARNREASPVLALAITQLQSVAIVHGLQAKAPSSRIMLADLLYAIGRTTEGLMNASVENDFDAEAARSASLAEGETVAIALIVNELIVNAVKHSVKSRRRPAVNVTLRGGTDAVTIRIMNQGELPNGFDATGGKGAGTGLGLVRALLPSEGGSLSFTAEAGRVEATLHIHPPVLISL